MSGLPPDLAGLLDAFDAADDQARELVAGLDEERLNWQPADGRAWSIAQCLDHLRRGNQAYLDALAPAIAEAGGEGVATGFRPLRPSWPARRFIASLEPGAKMKAKAPKAIQPPSRIAAGDVLEPFLQVHAALVALLRDAADLDLNRVILRNPLIGIIRMRAGSAFLLIAAHDRRHLAQARRVRDDPAFPAG